MAAECNSPSQISNLTSEIARPKSLRRWFRFSLGTLFIVLTIGCLGLGWYVNRAQNQRRAVAMVESLGRGVTYDWQDGAPSPRAPPEPRWLRERLGNDYFDDVVAVTFRRSFDIQVRELPVFDEHVSQLRHFPKLRFLSLAETSVTDAGIQHLARLRYLEDLDLSRTKISDAGLAHLGRLSKLRTLRLEECSITGEGFAHLTNLRELQYLDLADSKVDDAGLLHLAALPRLEFLWLERTTISDQGLATLAPLRLTSLNVKGAFVTDEGMAHLGDHPTLRLINICHTSVGDEGARRLCTIPTLDCLLLDDTRITDAALEDLARCQKLEDLYIRRNDLSQEAVARLRRALPNCSVVADLDR